MAGVDLNTPHSEKSEAKSLDARWEPQSIVWYILGGVDTELFAH